MSTLINSVRSTVSPDIGLDLGTANTVVYERGAGVIVSEPSVVAYDLRTDEIVAIGRSAKEMEGRAPAHFRIVRPLQRGTVSDFRAAQTLVARLVDRALATRPRLAPRLIASIPGCATDIECKAVEQAVRAAGARYTTYVPQAVAAAVGAGLDVTSLRAQMVVDIGGGTTEIAVLGTAGVIRLSSIQIGGDFFDHAIAARLRAERFAIGSLTAERLKVELGYAGRPRGTAPVRANGNSLDVAAPRARDVSELLIGEAMEEGIERILRGVVSVLETCPPDVAADLIESGITLTGGGALIAGLAGEIGARTNVPTMVAIDPLTCVARGAGEILGSPTLLERVRAARRPLHEVVSIFTYRDERKLFAVIGLVIVTALIALIQLDAAKTGKPSIIAIAVGSTAMVAQSAVTTTTGALRSAGSSVADVPHLSSENATLRARNRALVAENARLSETLSRVPEARAIARESMLEPGGIAAGVIGYDPENVSRQITIDRGASAGIGMDDGVIDGDGVVGRIVGVTPLESTVLFVTDGASKVPAVVQRGRWWGIATGTGVRMRLQYVSQDAKLKVGDSVVTGAGRSFQAGLRIGKISRIGPPRRRALPNGRGRARRRFRPAFARARDPARARRPERECGRHAVDGTVTSRIVPPPSDQRRRRANARVLDGQQAERDGCARVRPGSARFGGTSRSPSPSSSSRRRRSRRSLAFRGANVSFVTLLVAWYAVRTGSLAGVLFGAIAGSCEDAIAGSTGAAWTFATALAGFAAGRISRTWLADTKLALVPGAAAVTLLRYAAFATVMQMQGRPLALPLQHLHAALWQRCPRRDRRVRRVTRRTRTRRPFCAPSLNRRGRSPRGTWRLVAFILAVLVALASLVARLTQVQIFEGTRFAAAARANQIRRIPVAAPRGRMYDRHGRRARAQPAVVRLRDDSVGRARRRAHDAPTQQRARHSRSQVVETVAATIAASTTKISARSRPTNRTVRSCSQAISRRRRWRASPSRKINYEDSISKRSPCATIRITNSARTSSAMSVRSRKTNMRRCAPKDIRKTT